MSKAALAELYHAADGAREIPEGILDDLGPLGPLFAAFVEKNRRVEPLPRHELITLFDSCAADPDAAAVLRALHMLAPGGQRVGFREVNVLVDHYAELVDEYLREKGAAPDQVQEHDSAFGSGGDFYKTRHATTEACILVSPRVRICKIGTRNVTSEHGSIHAVSALHYQRRPLTGRDKELLAPLNDDLERANFAFASLAELGIPYSAAMVEARRELWRQWMHGLGLNPDAPSTAWHRALAATDIPIDIFKIVSPNAQPLLPGHHSTGVCHQALIPYVLGVFLERGTSGIIVHGYDGIDEFSTASSDLAPGSPTSLVIHVRAESIVIATLAPEDLGLRRAHLPEILQRSTSKREARIFRRILEGRDGSACRDFVVANAALLLVAGERVGYTDGALGAALREATTMVAELIDNGSALRNYLRVFRPTPRQRVLGALHVGGY